jgi:hypothetical protein
MMDIHKRIEGLNVTIAPGSIAPKILILEDKVKFLDEMLGTLLATLTLECNQDKTISSVALFAKSIKERLISKRYEWGEAV